MKHINKGSADTLPRSTRPKSAWWFPYPDDYTDSMGDAVEFLYSNSVVRRATKAPTMLKQMFGNDDL
jgi:hypothetical protein